MPLLIIDYSNFTLGYGVYKINEDTGELIEKLQLQTPEIVAYIQKEKDINKVKINAPRGLGEKIKEDLKADLGTEYAYRQIEIEVIE